MNSPCRRECPDRDGECRLHCEKWKKYEAEHFKELEEKGKKRKQHFEALNFKKEQLEKIRKRVR